ncbi:sulfatase [bacterium]|nr:sulfatase [bacterium]
MKLITRVLVLCVLFLVAGSLIVFSFKKSIFDDGKPNILIIVIDAWRRDHTGLYGYPRDTTPNIDRFSRKALTFENASSPSSWTVPSIASFFSGFYSTVHGVISHYDGKARSLSSDIVTFAEILKRDGYTTGAFIANHWVSKELGFGQGFDTFDHISDIYKPTAFMVNMQVQRWFEESPRHPFYVYVHYMDVHGPYRAPAPYSVLFKSVEKRPLTKDQRALLSYLEVNPIVDNNNLSYYLDQYDGEIRYTDHNIGSLLGRLHDLKKMEDLILVITSDHGEAFFEHGVCDHGYSLYSEEISIPLIMKYPDENCLTDMPSYETKRVDLMDISSTLLDRLALGYPYTKEGHEIAPDDQQKYIIAEEISKDMKGPPKIACIVQKYKAIYALDDAELVEFYDLEKDPAEKDNLIQTLPDKEGETKEIIEKHIRTSVQRKKELNLSENEINLDPGLIEKLKLLGYL